MAKFTELYEDIEKLFRDGINLIETLREVNITILANDRAKDIFKVTKANDLLKFRTGDDVVIVLNQKIFEQLPLPQQLIIVEEALAYISFDSENDKVVITSPDFEAHSGILRKHTFATIEVVRESVKTLYQAEKDAEGENQQTT